MRVGVISDTHGVVPATIDEVFAGVDRIIHAGDIGRDSVLVKLEAIAPVVAVHGNMDSGDLQWRYPDVANVRLAGHRVLVGHILERLLAAGVPEGVDVVITGHTHCARVERVDGVLYVNPGTVGARGRDGQGPTVALLSLGGGEPAAAIVELA